MSPAEPASQVSHPIITTEQPPTTTLGILRRLGPGLIIAGSIVGSGELIGTTATGAEAGYYLLWLILLGCVIKVFAQVEFGRYAISTGQSALDGMYETPGPVMEVWGSRRPGARSLKANWLLWFWLLMFLVGLGQLGGIVGGVGQAMAISLPLTKAGREYNTVAAEKTTLVFELHQIRSEATTAGSQATDSVVAERTTHIETRIRELDQQLKGDGQDHPGLEKRAIDHYLWATIITVITSVLLVAGRYGFIQWASAFMVASFTLVTVIDVLLLQSKPEWAVSWHDIANGFSRWLPPVEPAKQTQAIVTALSTFGIIGVGASELISYPYWCLEKGYARFTGPHDETPEWAARARGWIRVLRWDAWCSMIVYTFATVAFYLLGAAILGRFHLVPEGFDMIRTLSMMYEPVFGGWTQPLFLFGAFAVLYSTFFVANAGHARVCADALRVFGIERGAEPNRKAILIFSGLFPFLCLACYLVYSQPKALVLASGAMQALMLPMLAGAAVYFRYRRIDRRIAPSLLWDVCLWVSLAVMVVTSVSLVWFKFIGPLVLAGK